jgi:hypothetical protein
MSSIVLTRFHFITPQNLTNATCYDISARKSYPLGPGHDPWAMRILLLRGTVRAGLRHLANRALWVTIRTPTENRADEALKPNSNNYI